MLLATRKLSQLNSMNGRARQKGVSFIELLVVLSLVTVLASLTLAGVQSARESSRLSICMNRERQLCIGMQTFESKHRMLPNNGGRAGDNVIRTVEGDLVKPSTWDRAKEKESVWGVGSNGFSPVKQPGPWTYTILPEIELAFLVEENRFVPQVGSFLCATRGRAPSVVPKEDMQGRYQSGGYAMAKTDFAANHHVVRNSPFSAGFERITDGNSVTILMGEKSIDPSVHIPSTWFWDEPIWIGGSKGTARDGLGMIPDSIGSPYFNNWGSPHVSGVPFGYCDGRVEVASFTIDSEVLKEMLCPAGNQ